jgi:hypothetical protein
VADTSPIICDFCSSTEVEWTYPAHDIVVPEIKSRSVGAWAACGPCHTLIEADARDTLSWRAAKAMARAHKVNASDVIGWLRQMHAAFFRARKGPAYRFG